MIFGVHHYSVLMCILFMSIQVNSNWRSRSSIHTEQFVGLINLNLFLFACVMYILSLPYFAGKGNGEQHPAAGPRDGAARRLASLCGGAVNPVCAVFVHHVGAGDEEVGGSVLAFAQ
jgi:hypothetical protein